jgi:antitoxin ParD1/3/4
MEAIMPQRNVNLTEHFDQFIDISLASGRFSNASEIVREGLRLLEQQEREDEAKLEWLRAAAKEGFDDIERGDYIDLRDGDEIDAFMKAVHAEVMAELVADGGRG